MAILLGLLVALTLAGTAAAATYTVNDAGDAPDVDPATEPCDATPAPGAQCTLRAAIQQSNASADVNDTIVFSLFDDTVIGVPADLPVITDTVTIDGAVNCASVAIDLCFGVRRTTFDTASVLFDVEAPNVTIRALALTNAGVAVNLRDFANLAEVVDSWFGIPPGATTVEPNDRGIVSIADAGEFGNATGGGNLFAGGTRGIDLLSSNFTTIAGNRFGYLPDGTSIVASRVETAVDIASLRVAPGLVDLAVQNVIGGSPLTATAACDEACNLFGPGTSAGSAAIRLAAESPSPSDTRQPAATTAIRDNFIGVSPTGNECPAAPTPGYGVFVGQADQTTIGGAGAGNVIGCHQAAHIVSREGAASLVINDNLVGLMRDGVTPAPSAGSFAMGLGGSGLLVTSNRIGGTNADGPGPAGAAIYLSGSGAITGNEIGGTADGVPFGVAGDGIFLVGSGTESPGGSIISDNVIAEVGDDGIVVANGDAVEIRRNQIAGNGGDGIEVFGVIVPTSGTIIGDEDPAGGTGDANTISGNGADAIHLQGDFARDTVIGVNFGSGNGAAATDLFIDLVGADGPGNGAGGPNEGVAAPVLSTTATTASGTAEPGAEVFVYRRDGGAQNRLDAFLGRGVAEPDGSFSVTYQSALPGGTAVAATQEAVGKGTSELASATVPARPDGGGGNGGGGGGTPAPPGEPAPPPDPPRPPLPPPPPDRTDADVARANLVRIAAALRRARLRGIARRAGVRVAGIEALRAGVFTFRATARRGARRVTVLTGTVRFTAAGTGRLTVRATRTGRRLTRGTRRLRLATRLTFAPATGTRLAASRAVTLRR